MAQFEEEIINHPTFDESKLLSYGFTIQGGAYFYQTTLKESGFQCAISIKDGVVTTSLFDPETKEPYDLYRIERPAGGFSASLREEVKDLLLDIKDKAAITHHWSDEVASVLAHFKAAYGEEIEFPWNDDDAIIRRKDNRKWYGLFMVIPLQKLGINTDESGLVLCVKEDASIVDHIRFFPAYHMNKKSWVDIVVNDHWSDDKIIELLENSRNKVSKG